MSLINVIKVSLCFADREIFRDIGFQVEPGEKIGLIGPNGAGKTTLLRLLNEEVVPDSGEVRAAKGVSMGYLSQDVQEILSGPLLESVLNSVPGRTGLGRRLEKTEKELAAAQTPGDQSFLGERLAELHQDKSTLDFRFPRHEAEKILAGLGFHEKDFSSPVSSLSGGWKTRAALASILYRAPDLLLLDEPTNHLDIPSVHWLEQFLQGFRGAVMLVSHDREFLNRQVGRIFSFEPEGMRIYTGNYDFYLKTRQEEKRLLEAKARKQDQKVKDAQKFIDRFRSKASKARQAQSKIKLVRKMEIIDTHKREKSIHFSFPAVKRSGRDVVRISGVTKSFGDNCLYRGLDMRVSRGERIALIGPNGCGKTTLLRIIAGEIKSDEGEISLGQGVEMGYFAQHHSDMLNPGNTVLEEVYQVVPGESLSFVRGVCGAFLFSGNDVDKPVHVLSGGERARVSLAKLLLKPGNLMVMDEPTNHLDLSSSEILIKALGEYDGTLLFVSHNQFFINSLATRIWDMTGGDLVEYPGNLSEYYRHLDEREKIDDDHNSGAGPDVNGASQDSDLKKGMSKKDQKRERAERRKFISERLGPVQAELDSIEESIEGLETRQKEVEKQLADPDLFSDKNRSVPLMKEYGMIREKQESLLVRWEEYQEKLEAVKEELEIGEG